MFDGDLIVLYHNFIYHETKNLLFGAKTRVLERHSDMLTKLFYRFLEKGPALLLVLLLAQSNKTRFKSRAFLGEPRTSGFEIGQLDDTCLIGPTGGKLR